MKITDILAEDVVVPSLAGSTKEEIIEELAGVVAEHHPEIDRERLVTALEDRERLNSTALGEGVAIPHGKLPGLKRVVAAFGRSEGPGVDFQSLDGKPTHLFFLLVAPEDSAGAHLKALARISRLLKDEGFRARLMRAEDAAALYRTIREEDDKY
jgi:PTS system nitrogen regulatory IIA component